MYQAVHGNTHTLCGWPCQTEWSWASIQNSSFRYIWFHVYSNHPAFTLVRLSLSLAPSNGNWQTGFRCKYKCHCNYSGERSLQTNSMWGCVLLYRYVCMKTAVGHIAYSNADGHNSLSFSVTLPIILISIFPSVTDWLTASFEQWRSFHFRSHQDVEVQCQTCVTAIN